MHPWNSSNSRYLPNIASTFDGTLFWRFRYRFFVHRAVDERAVLCIAQIIRPFRIIYVEILHLDIGYALSLISFVENGKFSRLAHRNIVDAEIVIFGREVTSTLMQIVGLKTKCRTSNA